MPEVSSTTEGQEAGAGEGRPRAPGDFGLDAIWDLAWQLTGDERRAERLLDTALRARGLRLARQNGRDVELLGLLIRGFLRQQRSVGYRLSRLGSLWCWPGRRYLLARSGLEVGLARLRPTERVCLLLRERLGLSVAEIVQIAGLEHEQARLALFVAREQLRALLAVECVECNEGVEEGGR